MGILPSRESHEYPGAFHFAQSGSHAMAILPLTEHFFPSIESLAFKQLYACRDMQSAKYNFSLVSPELIRKYRYRALERRQLQDEAGADGEPVPPLNRVQSKPFLQHHARPASAAAEEHENGTENTDPAAAADDADAADTLIKWIPVETIDEHNYGEFFRDDTRCVSPNESSWPFPDGEEELCEEVRHPNAAAHWRTHDAARQCLTCDEDFAGGGVSDEMDYVSLEGKSGGLRYSPANLSLSGSSAQYLPAGQPPPQQKQLQSHRNPTADPATAATFTPQFAAEEFELLNRFFARSPEALYNALVVEPNRGYLVDTNKEMCELYADEVRWLNARKIVRAYRHQCAAEQATEGQTVTAEAATADPLHPGQSRRITKEEADEAATVPPPRMFLRPAPQVIVVRMSSEEEAEARAAYLAEQQLRQQRRASQRRPQRHSTASDALAASSSSLSLSAAGGGGGGAGDLAAPGSAPRSPNLHAARSPTITSSSPLHNPTTRYHRFEDEPQYKDGRIHLVEEDGVLYMFAYNTAYVDPKTRIQQMREKSAAAAAAAAASASPRHDGSSAAAEDGEAATTSSPPRARGVSFHGVAESTEGPDGGDGEVDHLRDARATQHAARHPHSDDDDGSGGPLTHADRQTSSFYHTVSAFGDASGGGGGGGGGKSAHKRRAEASGEAAAAATATSTTTTTSAAVKRPSARSSAGAAEAADDDDEDEDTALYSAGRGPGGRRQQHTAIFADDDTGGAARSGEDEEEDAEAKAAAAVDGGGEEEATGTAGDGDGRAHASSSVSERSSSSSSGSDSDSDSDSDSEAADVAAGRRHRPHRRNAPASASSVNTTGTNETTSGTPATSAMSKEDRPRMVQQLELVTAARFILPICPVRVVGCNGYAESKCRGTPWLRGYEEEPEEDAYIESLPVRPPVMTGGGFIDANIGDKILSRAYLLGFQVYRNVCLDAGLPEALTRPFWRLGLLSNIPDLQISREMRFRMRAAAAEVELGYQELRDMIKGTENDLRSYIYGFTDILPYLERASQAKLAQAEAEANAAAAGTTSSYDGVKPPEDDLGLMEMAKMDQPSRRYTDPLTLPTRASQTVAQRNMLFPRSAMEFHTQVTVRGNQSLCRVRTDAQASFFYLIAEATAPVSTSLFMKPLELSAYDYGGSLRMHSVVNRETGCDELLVLPPPRNLNELLADHKRRLRLRRRQLRHQPAAANAEAADSAATTTPSTAATTSGKCAKLSEEDPNAMPPYLVYAVVHPSGKAQGPSLAHYQDNVRRPDDGEDANTMDEAEVLAAAADADDLHADTAAGDDAPTPYAPHQYTYPPGSFVDSDMAIYNVHKGRWEHFEYFHQRQLIQRRAAKAAAAAAAAAATASSNATTTEQAEQATPRVPDTGDHGDIRGSDAEEEVEDVHMEDILLCWIKRRLQSATMRNRTDPGWLRDGEGNIVQEGRYCIWGFEHDAQQYFYGLIPKFAKEKKGKRHAATATADRGGSVAAAGSGVYGRRGGTPQSGTPRQSQSGRRPQRYPGSGRASGGMATPPAAGVSPNRSLAHDHRRYGSGASEQDASGRRRGGGGRDRAGGRESPGTRSPASSQRSPANSALNRRLTNASSGTWSPQSQRSPGNSALNRRTPYPNAHDNNNNSLSIGSAEATSGRRRGGRAMDELESPSESVTPRDSATNRRTSAHASAVMAPPVSVGDVAPATPAVLAGPAARTESGQATATATVTVPPPPAPAPLPPTALTPQPQQQQQQPQPSSSRGAADVSPAAAAAVPQGSSTQGSGVGGARECTDEQYGENCREPAHHF